jgi:hypothetical protein
MIKNLTHTLSFNLKDPMIITNPMCDTEENAIIDFKSVVFKHLSPTITDPINLIEMHLIFQ